MTTDDHVRRVPVVIVGAGPTGITAATLLAQYGVECLVVDRRSGVYRQPRAVHMDDEVCRIVARLGIAGDFAAISRQALGLRLLDNQLRVLAEFHRGAGRAPHGFPKANMFDQPEFEELLRVNLARYPHATLQSDTEVIDVVEDPRAGLIVRTAGRADGDEQTIVASYVLGCDGANSLVRSRIGSHMRDLDFDQRWLVIDVATTADLHQWDGVHQVCDPVRAATYMRIGDTRYRWEFEMMPTESSDDFSTLSALQPLLAPWTADVSVRDLDLIRVAEYTFRAQIAERWRRGNIFLLGDAAHLTPPFIGQGMGAGLRDAMNLAWKLAGVLSGCLPPSDLDSYERERKPHARQMIRLALNVGRAMTAGGGIGNLVRRIIVPRIHFVPGMRSKVVDSTTPALHRSSMVVKSPRLQQLAGRLCPNPLLSNGNRLDNELGAGFALVTTGPLTATELALTGQRGVRVHVAQPGDAVTEWLRRGHAAAAIIRPDRTVMRAGRDVSQLCDVIPAFGTHGARLSRGAQPPEFHSQQ